MAEGRVTEDVTTATLSPTVTTQSNLRDSHGLGSHTNVVRSNNNDNDDPLLLQFSKCETLPLQVAVEVVDYPGSKFVSLVDNGAAINLITESAVNQLVGIAKYPSVVARVTGVGNATIPITEYVILRLRFNTGYVSTLEEFYVLPDSATDNTMVIGVTLLRANSLLPDMSSYQLFQRSGHNLKVIASDITKIPSREVVCSQNIVIPGNQIQMVGIEIPGVNIESNETTMNNSSIFMIEGQPTRHTELPELHGLGRLGVEVVAGFVNLDEPRKIAFCNYGESPKFIKQGQIVGIATALPIVNDNAE